MPSKLVRAAHIDFVSSFRSKYLKASDSLSLCRVIVRCRWLLILCRPLNHALLLGACVYRPRLKSNTMLDSVLFHCGPALAGFEQHTMAISIYLRLGSSLQFTNFALKPPVYRVSDKLFCPLVLTSILTVRISTYCTTLSTCYHTLKTPLIQDSFSV